MIAEAYVEEGRRICEKQIAEDEENRYTMYDGSMSKQVGGNHYKKQKIQPWTIVDEYKLNFYEGNALKYLLRSKTDRLEDLAKAIHYLEKEIENIKGNK